MTHPLPLDTAGVLWVAALDRVPIEERVEWVRAMEERVAEINAARAVNPLNEVVVFDYPAAAISCCHNGRRARGIARITGIDADGWVILDDHIRVRPDEIAMRGRHTFEPDASGWGCVVCGFNLTAEIHVGASAEEHLR